MDSTLDLSVITVSWNTKNLLRDCLDSIYEQAGNIDFEVIVVDNASVDGSCNMVRDLFPNAVLIANSTNRGYAAALNQGMRIAKGKYFLILNSDIIICDKAVQRTVAYAKEHPEAAVVGCQVWEDQDKVQMTCFKFPSVLNLFLDTFGLNRLLPNNRFFGREWMFWWHRDSERQVDVVSGMFMLVRRKAVDEVGLMDEQFFLLFEETDWCYRFAKGGWKMMFWPGAKIIHVHGGSGSRKKASLKMMVQFQKSTLIFFKKHYSYAEYLLARLLLAVNCGIRCMAWGFLKLYKQLTGEDTMYEATKMSGFWYSLKYCVFGSEIGTETE